MKIAILGTRGIPARYGGFETLADQLSARLAQRGHQVTVYCRRHFTSPDDVYDSRIQRVILPSVASKYFDTFLHSFISVLHVIFTDSEVILMCNVATSPFAWIPRLFGKPVALNVDGLDRKRRKWNTIGQWFLHACEVLSVFTPTCTISDAKTVQDYYKVRYGKKCEMIAYGAEPLAISTFSKEFDLLPRRYILYVARLEPENNPELVIEAYKKVKTDWPLVIVGDNQYRNDYVRHLREMSDERVRFLGAIYGDQYWMLQLNAGLFIFAGEVGGVHPALVEAMAASNAIVYLDTPANRETAGDSGVPFAVDPVDLTRTLTRLIADPDTVSSLKRHARETARQKYSWDRVVEQYEAVFAEMLSKLANEPATA